MVDVQLDKMKKPRKLSFALLLLVLLAGLAGIAVTQLAKRLLATEYAPGYSETAFRKIAVGDDKIEVLDRLGEPLQVWEKQPETFWVYGRVPEADIDDLRNNYVLESSYTVIIFSPEEGVQRAYGQIVRDGQLFLGDGQNYLGLTAEEIGTLKGQTAVAIQQQFGEPQSIYTDSSTEVWRYSRSPQDSHYHLRRIWFDAEGKVVRIDREIYWD